MFSLVPFLRLRGRTLSLIQLPWRLTRSLAYKSAQLVSEKDLESNSNFKQTHAQKIRQLGESKCIDPFGLDYSGLELIVQGLYTKSEVEGDENVQVNTNSTTSCELDNGSGVGKHTDSPNFDIEKFGQSYNAKPKSSRISVEEKYKSWFVDSKPNIIEAESAELLRATQFGSIRFDSDNKVQYFEVPPDEPESMVPLKRDRIPSPLFPIQEQETINEAKTSCNPKMTSPTSQSTNKVNKYKSEPKLAVFNRQFDANAATASTATIENTYGKESIKWKPVAEKFNSHVLDKQLNLGDLDPEDYSTESYSQISTEYSWGIRSVISERAHKIAELGRRIAETKTDDMRIPKSKMTSQRVKLLPTNEIDKEVPAVVSPLNETKKIDTDSNDSPTHKLRPVPRIYEMPDFNKITHIDMWNVIKHCLVFQNDFLMALNKPYGLPMHSKARDCRHTLIEFLDELAKLGKCEKVYPLHRLDRDATGVLLLAKTQQAADIIKKRFKDRQIEKIYLTITKKCPHIQQGIVKIPISEGKIGGTSNYRSTLKPDLTSYKIATKQSFAKEAITHFKILRSDADCAFLQINTQTGIKHQIRVHLAMGLGCPILGDHKYSHREKLAPQRLGQGILDKIMMSQTKVRHLPLHLHCSQVKFSMPEGFAPTKEPIFITARPPQFFSHTLKNLLLS